MTRNAAHEPFENFGDAKGNDQLTLTNQQSGRIAVSLVKIVIERLTFSVL